jgi:hypothetical protein
MYSRYSSDLIMLVRNANHSDVCTESLCEELFNRFRNYRMKIQLLDAGDKVWKGEGNFETNNNNNNNNNNKLDVRRK